MVLPAASNALCRRLGFAHRTTTTVEFGERTSGVPPLADRTALPVVVTLLPLVGAWTLASSAPLSGSLGGDVVRPVDEGRPDMPRAVRSTTEPPVVIQGDTGGHVRRALAAFPVPEVAERVGVADFVEG
jgi:hypothetical protein